MSAHYDRIEGMYSSLWYLNCCLTIALRQVRYDELKGNPIILEAYMDDLSKKTKFSSIKYWRDYMETVRIKNNLKPFYYGSYWKHNSWIKQLMLLLGYTSPFEKYFNYFNNKNEPLNGFDYQKRKPRILRKHF